jgi:hypothetical protein
MLRLLKRLILPLILIFLVGLLSVMHVSFSSNNCYIPEILEASIGNVLGYYSVQLKDTKIVYEFFKRSQPIQTINFTPTPEDWQKFNSLIKEANIWEWETSYVEHNLFDGTQWRLKIEQCGKKKIIEGHNRYPSPQQFNKYLEAIRVLIDNNYFQ